MLAAQRARTTEGQTPRKTLKVASESPTEKLDSNDQF
jgi:hypothetical protein